MCLLTKTETSALEIEKNPSYIEKNAYKNYIIPVFIHFFV